MTDNNPPPSHSLITQGQPLERLFIHGVKSLSDVELLTILIGNGTYGENSRQVAQNLISEVGGLSALARTSPIKLAGHHGLGRAETATIIAALELGFRLSLLPLEDRPQILSANDAIALVRDMNTLTQEHVRILLLDASQRLITTTTLYIGTVNMSIIRVSEVYREAIIRNSPSIIMVHNHPSGDANPSPEDIELTRTLIAAGRLMDIQLVDHIIIAGQSWVSLRDKNLGFEGY